MGPYPLATAPTAPTDPDAAVCDGALEADEGGVVDGPFDRDGDGYLDAGDPGCAAAYTADRLDCDDGDPDVRPGVAEIACNGRDDDCAPDTPDGVDGDGDGATACDDCDDDDPDRTPSATEVCGDGIDNDCDGRVDPGCPDAYSGVYQLDQVVAYTCGFGMVNIDFDQLAFDVDYPYSTATPTTGARPGAMVGAIEADGSFVFEQSVPATAAGCDEYYRITGQFAGDGTFTATFACDFVGFCAACAYQAFTDLVGTRE